ncbi:MAG: restriction endonuclease subunit S [Deltaproteobacteria bacterium]|nr:restriction endonuclease subunit S [Deltaproteobacteria bacterium]
MPKDIRNGRVDEVSVARISERKANELSRHLLKQGSVVFPRRGEISKCAYIDETQTGFLCGTGCIKIEPPEDRLRAKFLFYYLGIRESIKWLERNAVGTTMLNLNTKILGGLPVPSVSVQHQDAIVEILSAYDGLIENNRRRIQLFEESARLLYKEWFMYLRFPGHEHVKVIDGVPEGWERRPLRACATFLSGGTPSKKRSEFWEGDIPWVSSGALTQMRIHRTSLNITAEAVAAGSRLVPQDTVLMVVRGMSLAKELRMGMTARSVAFNQDIKALLAVPDVDPLLLFQSLDNQRESIRERTGDASHGTKKLDTPVLSEVPILVPTDTVQALFRAHVAPLHMQWDTLDQENQLLSRARDLLLPRLMNGELAV